MKTGFKKADVLNRRQVERPVQLGIHDISCARYFTIGEQSFRYALRAAQFSPDYTVYDVDNDGRQCIGYASPINGKKFVIRVRHHGLDWSVKVSISSVKIYGNKNPND
jgi:hypothetical protein